MRQDRTCPTCGARLGPLHHRDALRRCDACQRDNPQGFRYCGFCAAPMETAAEQDERIHVAAPPGGWPSLARELVELRFFLDRGELDEAFELLSILRERHPGHPALVELAREPAARKPRPDTQVYQVVDAVLADSSALGAALLPRRAVPQWNAPVTDDADEGKKTRAHAAVSLGADEDEPTSKRPPIRGAPPRPARARTDKHLGAVPRGEAPAAKPGKRASGAARAVPADAGLTVAVPTLQPPKPFSTDDDEEARTTAIMEADPGLRAARASKKVAVAGKGAASEPAPARGREPEALPRRPTKAAVRKQALEEPAPAKAREPKKRSGKQGTVAPTPAEPSERARSRGARFGQGVLGRLGGKGKG
jgi:hypothetical protein